MIFETSKFYDLDKFDFIIENLDGKDEVVKLVKKTLSLMRINFIMDM